MVSGAGLRLRFRVRIRARVSARTLDVDVDVSVSCKCNFLHLQHTHILRLREMENEMGNFLHLRSNCYKRNLFHSLILDKNLNHTPNSNQTSKFNLKMFLSKSKSCLILDLEKTETEKKKC
jgi:hypothetical protein